MNQTPHCLANSSLVLRFGLVLLAASAIGAQSRITKPAPTNTNSNNAKRAHIATVRSTDSAEGSRVAINSDQSLNDYEAYRRGDRFYVKIPGTDVPRAEGLRGRGFVDVKTQKSGDSTILSFQLQPGATAHVEQRANKLDVVVSVPGGNSSAVASNRTKETMPAVTSGIRGADSSKRNGPTSNANKSSAKNASNTNSAKPLSATTNANRASSNSTSNAKPVAVLKPSPTPVASPNPKSSVTPKPSPTPKSSVTPSKSLVASSSPTATPTNIGAQSQSDWWARLKERGHYWILLAQLNPIPVALGAGLLLLVIGLLLFQRRRARATRRVKPVKVTSKKAAPVEAVAASSTAPVVASTVNTPEENDPPAVAVDEKPEAIAHAPIVAAAAPIAAVSNPDDKRRERISRAAEETGKLLAAESFDEGILGSNDKETRRLVCAELSSALVGRNIERRERAREAFMKYGYFDDATRDLRIADSENERAAAARRLSFVHDREATPHLVGALNDSSPDVRRAAVEALTDLRDPEAIAPLNSLLQTENDRKVPRHLITQAIEACATTFPQTAPEVMQPSTPSAVPEFVSALPQPAPPSIETEREVIEL